MTVPRFRLEHGGRWLRIVPVDRPRLVVGAGAGDWCWEIHIQAKVPGGVRPLRFEGAGATHAQALRDARRWMTSLLGYTPVEWTEKIEPASRPQPRRSVPSPPVRAPAFKTAPAPAREVWEQTVPDKKAKQRLPKLVRAETFKVARPGDGELVRAVKRDCHTGRFVPAKAKANDCKLPPPPLPWWHTSAPVPSMGRVCYPTRRDALRVFRAANEDQIDRGGGLFLPAKGGGEYDSINEKYELRGKRRVGNLAQAIAAVMPHGRPYCLDQVDLDALNDTQPAKEVGGFVLPDIVEEHKLWQKVRKKYEAVEAGGEEAQASDLSDEEIPF